MNLEPSDEELMRAYQKGNSEAFEILYQRVSGKIYGYLKKRLQRRELADECFQIVFSKFHQSRSQYDPAYSVQQWLYVIAKTTLVDYFRKQNRELNIDSEAPVENLESPQSENTPVGESTNEVLKEPLGQLSPQQRKVVQWRILDEVSYEEIAKRLDQSETSIRQILSRALRKLRSVMTQGEGKL